MKLTILGAGGFIGSHLVEHLLARGEHGVTGVDVSDEKLNGIGGSAFQFEKADIHELPASLVRDADVVVDLVAYANPSIYVNDPLSVFELNFESNLQVVRDCVRYGTRLIQYSTSEVYGKSPGTSGRYREDESDLVMGPVAKQRWIYAAAKQLVERVIHAYGLRGDLDYTVLRPFNFLGPRIDYLVPEATQGGPRVFAHFMSALLQEGPIQLVDGGHVRRTFLSIYDANDAFQAILDRPEAHSETFNVGNPSNDTTIGALAARMLLLYGEMTGRVPQCEILDVPGEEFYGPGYEDMDRLPPDISKLSALGWSPSRDLDQTLRDAIAHYAEHPAVTSPTLH
jgi:UDP-apiose/xylose synthase